MPQQTKRRRTAGGFVPIGIVGDDSLGDSNADAEEVESVVVGPVLLLEALEAVEMVAHAEVATRTALELAIEVYER